MRLGKNIILVLLSALIFSACGGDDSKNNTINPTEDTNTTQPPLVIDGYTLPPMPDKALNDSTLLGIDSNNNGVRDDVEIWIYTTYEKPIERAVFMQSARAYQIVIQEPEKALENLPIIQAATACKAYWSYDAKDNNEPFYLEEYRDYFKEIYPIQFNTGARFLAHEKYNQTLSGGVYKIVDDHAMKSQCDFNVDALLGK